MRWRPSAAPLALGLLLQAGAAGCARPAEEAVLGRFFEASRLRDRTRLGAIATVVFEPATDGMVTGFRIENVTSEQSARWPQPDAAEPAGTPAALLLELSLGSREPGADAAHYSAEGRGRDEGLAIVSKEVTIVAAVRPLQGATTDRVLVVSLQRVVLSRGGESVAGRWIVTGVRGRPVAAARPAEGPSASR